VRTWSASTIDVRISTLRTLAMTWSCHSGAIRGGFDQCLILTSCSNRPRFRDTHGSRTSWNKKRELRYLGLRYQSRRHRCHAIVNLGLRCQLSPALLLSTGLPLVSGQPTPISVFLLSLSYFQLAVVFVGNKIHQWMLKCYFMGVNVPLIRPWYTCKLLQCE